MNVWQIKSRQKLGICIYAMLVPFVTRMVEFENLYLKLCVS